LMWLTEGRLRVTGDPPYYAIDALPWQWSRLDRIAVVDIDESRAREILSLDQTARFHPTERPGMITLQRR
ncbi:MAG: hypothetical protein ACREIT_08245, partial [Tepidisphaeraceae bacterium]